MYIPYYILIYPSLMAQLFLGCDSFSLGSSPNADLLPDGLAGSSDYEVLEVHQEGDEDVVRLRRRAGDEDKCNGDSDCINYSGWTESGHMECNDEQSELVKRSFEKRGRKGTYACDGTKLGGRQTRGLLLLSPAWPVPEKLEEKYHRAYDIGDPTEPLEPEWFQLSRHQQRWKGDVGTGERCYDAEHVLEWQLLQEFIEADTKEPIAGKVSRCEFLLKHFTSSNLNLPDAKVMVAKDHAKDLKSGDHFDYEETTYQFSKYKYKKEAARPIDWVAFQWPGTAGSAKPSNPWEYELVLASSKLNGRKKVVWSGHNIFPDPVLQSGTTTMSQKNQDNTETLEWLFINKKYNQKDGLGQWKENRGTCKALDKFNTAMNIVQYHNDPYIQELMRAQVKRVGEAFEYLETQILPGTDWNGELFKARNLKQEWLDWITVVHTDRLDKLIKALEDKVGIFKGNPDYITKLKRWDFAGIFSRATKPKSQKIPNCGTETDQKAINKRVQLLLDAYGKLPKLVTELKLDNDNDLNLDD